jgi:hypothetical protein
MTALPFLRVVGFQMPRRGEGSEGSLADAKWMQCSKSCFPPLAVAHRRNRWLGA